MSDARSARIARWSVLGLAGLLMVTAHLAVHPRPHPSREPRWPLGGTNRILPVAVEQTPRSNRPSRDVTPGSDVDPGWASATSTRTGIPAPAIAAYGHATLAVAAQSPGCHLGWTTLAAIGDIESRHGTIGNRRLLPDGRSSRPIIGPALDGTHFAAEPSTPQSVRWHGDLRWDHAIGAMQFIPATWQQWGTDGDADGTRDPNDIFDASLATARYLCASGADLRTPDGWTAAVLSYNHSTTYLRQVLRAANTYADQP